MVCGIECGCKSRNKKEDPGRKIRCFKEVGEEHNRTNATERGKGNTRG